MVLDFTFTTRHIHSWASFLLWSSFFILIGANSNHPLLFPVAYWTPSNLGCSSYGIISFCLSMLFMDSPGKNIRVVHHFLLQWTMFCQSSPPWAIHLGWACIAWLIASLAYISPFSMTRLWFMKSDTVIRIKLFMYSIMFFPSHHRIRL